MRSYSRPLTAIALAASTLFLASCSNPAGNYSYTNVTVTLSPQITSLPVNGTQTFTTSTTNAPNYPIFYTYPGGAIGGTITSNTNNATGTYTAPSTPPIYTAAQISNGAVQGAVIIQVFVSNSLTNIFSDASASETIAITAPSVIAGISPATGTVARASTLQFLGYAVGNVNGGITWQVNGVTGGSTAFGTITQSGLYTAPSAIPPTGVTVTIISAADPTKTALATLTIT